MSHKEYKTWFNFTSHCTHRILNRIVPNDIVEHRELTLWDTEYSVFRTYWKCGIFSITPNWDVRNVNLWSWLVRFVTDQHEQALRYRALSHNDKMMFDKLIKDCMLWS